MLVFCSNVAKNRDKSRYVYRFCGVAFDGLGSWSFGNDFARNAIIFGVDSSSSSHTDNRKNNFLVLDKGPTDDSNDSIDAADKRFCIIFSKAKTTFCLRFHYNRDNSNLLVKGKEIHKFNRDNKNVNFLSQFCYGSISNKFEVEEVSLKGNVYDFSVHYNAIDKCDILNMHKYLMVKNNIK